MGAYRKGSKSKPGVPAAMHQPSILNSSRCGACGRAWPCSTAIEADEVPT